MYAQITNTTKLWPISELGLWVKFSYKLRKNYFLPN